MNMWNKRNMLKGPFQTPTFTGAKFNGNEENLLFSYLHWSAHVKFDV